MRDLEEFIQAIRDEHERALNKYPAPNTNGTALAAEAGEVANALNKETRDEVVTECVQTAVMAARLAIEGDPYQDAYRRSAGLDRTCAGRPVVSRPIFDGSPSAERTFAVSHDYYETHPGEPTGPGPVPGSQRPGMFNGRGILGAFIVGALFGLIALAVRSM